MNPNPSATDDTVSPLRHLPVIVLNDAVLLDVVLAGVRRAGGDPDIHALRRADSAMLRTALSSGAEVVVAVCEFSSMIEVIRTVRDLGGRPIPVLSIRGGDDGPSVSPASLSLLADPDLTDLEIPVPTTDDDGTRRLLWDQLRRVRSEDRHHLVEVDGRPAVDDRPGGPSRPVDSWAALAAGAAGVLAGRMAASDRRWRA
jgi:hypothetical protein